MTTPGRHCQENLCFRTLDYASTQECMGFACPIESHPHFWVAPVINIKGANNIECSAFTTCFVEGTADEISTWLLEQVALVKNNNRAPLTLRLNSYWFSFTKNGYERFTKFLNEVGKLDEVFLPQPTQLQFTMTVSCALTNIDGELRYMKSCVPCPEVYPWKGNPLGEA
ncbi:hypothetical protein MTP99_009184 [Tenebrio molitor]|nr:hypothetical protein MTP99_009184 [Tenebrio molitor]